MANPTTNFGWVMPASTSLVTNLPADFNTFGQAVDTSMAELKGVTTGQVLSKTSNTDMDFTWVAQDDSNAIQNAIVDAKGDLIAATAADTPARLAVGTNGYVLTADSAAATGMKWAAASAGSLTLLQTLSCTTSSTTSSSIAGTYKSIYIELVGGQLNGEQITLRFNSDASGVYGAASISTANMAMTDTSIALSYQNVGNTATNLMALTIPNYSNTSTHKIVQAYGMSYNGSSYMINNLVGAWRSTSAITTVTFKSSVGASITATAYIYGVN
jgi:hypothetical protein